MSNNIWSGTKVRLRPVIPSDWNKFHNNDSDSEGARLSDELHFPRSEDGTKAWAENQASKAPDGDNVMMSIETLDGELVGSISTNSCNPRHGTFKYGVAVFRQHWRKGFASDAVRLMLRYYFEELRYQKITASVYAFNKASIAFHQHLGFVQEGALRNMIFTRGKHFDEVVFGLTKAEYEALNK